jgi:putative mRNA 3-end processing factor
MLRLTHDGLFCEAGGFHIDPWRPVPRAVGNPGQCDDTRPAHGFATEIAFGKPIGDGRGAT